ncbi:hypothetical protein JD77_05009 [Micromonospora olivasterospora]|uniref:Uncharacterized protein n=1 Tax=Micromonospora olivasterospora TaxID=1880 RepID=A0A562IG47_MICOL|nr:hypothetical protein JD77_05009 [Micromonospora olivasterospora]
MPSRSGVPPPHGWGSSPADIYASFLAETTNRLHLTDEALTSWRPPKATRGRKAKA